jgi:thiol-disulfide isomerase/thioredoxin
MNVIDRLLILIVCGLVVYLAWQVVRVWQARRLQKLAAEQPFGTIVPPGRPALVAFSLPTCVDCRARQAPTLARLSTSLGDQVTITTLSADAHMALADRLGIMTVPSTVVLDRQGAVRFLNQGFADEQRLAEQLAAVNK